jgi:hypothetical protein
MKRLTYSLGLAALFAGSLLAACRENTPAVSGPAASATATPATAPRSAQEDDIREVVFRYQFGKNASGQQQNTGVYCLEIVPRDLGKQPIDPDYSVNPVDPGEAFMKRFAGNQPAVKKGSECSQSVDGVKDKATGASGLVFRVENIRWLKDTEVEVGGGYFEGGLSASGNVFKVAKESNKWVVKEDRMLWIS